MQKQRKQEEIIKEAKQYANYILNKTQDKTEKFIESKTVCQACYGTNFRTLYKHGKRGVIRCEASKWSEDEKRYICSGNPNAEDLLLKNKKDLASVIWKKIMFVGQKEAFLTFLAKEHNTQKLGDLLISELEVLCHKANRLFIPREPNTSQTQTSLTKSKAA